MMDSPRDRLQMARSSAAMRVAPALLVASVAFSSIAVLLAGIRIVTLHAPIGQVPRVVALMVTVMSCWIPIAPLVGYTWRWAAAHRWFLVGHAIGALAVALLQPVWMAFVIRAWGGHVAPFWPLVVAWLDTNVLLYVGIVTAWWAVHHHVRELADQLAEARLASSIADAQLHILTLQLQPHFICNTLNLISQLAYREPKVASATLADLRSLLDESLRHAFHRETALHDELRFLNAYLDIQRRRFRERLLVTVAVDPEVTDAAVPHLLLQPIVENAIVHGIAHRAEGGRVEISAQRTDDWLVLRVADDGAGMASLPRREGVGLSNTRLRLDQLFRGQYQLTLAPRPSGGTEAAITIPFRTVRPDVVTGEILAPPPGAPTTAGATTPLASNRGWLTHYRALSPSVRIVLAWLVIGLIWTQIDSVERLFSGDPAPWTVTARTSAIGAGLWALLTAGVVWLARTLDVMHGTRRARLGRLAAHFGCAVAVAATHVLTWIAITRLITPGGDAKLQYDAMPWFVWDVMAYFAIAAFTVVVTLGVQHRRAVASLALSEQRLSLARLSAMRVRLQPQLLVDGLDALSRAVGRDARRAERAIARMGDVLRLIRAEVRDELVPLSAELALLHAYDDVMRAGSRPAVPAALLPDPRDTDGVAIASATLAPLAAALGAVLLSATVHRDGPIIAIALHVTTGRPVDESRLSELRARLDAVYGASVASLTWSVQGGARLAQLRLPARAWESDAAAVGASLDSRATA